MTQNSAVSLLLTPPYCFHFIARRGFLELEDSEKLLVGKYFIHHLLCPESFPEYRGKEGKAILFLFLFVFLRNVLFLSINAIYLAIPNAGKDRDP